jgi:hypothetical protein
VSALDRERMIAAIERAKLLVAAAKEKKEAKLAAEEDARKNFLGLKAAEHLPTAPVTHAANVASMQWNPEQQQAIDHGYFGKSFCLIGAAGTGKTTTLKAILANLIEHHRLPPLNQSTKHLAAGAPGVALISYTRRAVRNIAKQMNDQLKGHCITFHKLVEYEPQYYTEWDEEKQESVNKMRFAPARTRFNPLPRNLKLIIVDESSMLSIDYFMEVIEALPDPSQVQFIFLGDLNQLPPVYGQAILGKKLLELPIIELTRVYRQALESPIIALALAVKDNNFDTFSKQCADGTFDIQWVDDKEPRKLNFDDPNDIMSRPNPKHVMKKVTISKPNRGKVTLHPWKKVLPGDDALMAMQSQLGLWMKDGTYDPDEDLVLCPWNKTSDRGFGTGELNLAIADYIARTGYGNGGKPKLVHEVIAGFNKYYFAVGDKLMIDKMEAIILEINPNIRYLGKRPQSPSVTLNRWGNGGGKATDAGVFGEDLTDEQIDYMLEHAAEIDDRTAEASHAIKVLFVDADEEETISKSATLNNTTFAYAITVHKAQGSECRRVFMLLHEGHASMCSRELIYTAITRAAEELYIVMPPKLLAKAAAKPRIKGDTLAAKLEFFNSRMQEKEE